MTDISTAFMRCHSCAHHAQGMDVGANPGHRLPFVTLDMHCHILVPEVETLVAQETAKLGEASAQRQLMGETSFSHNQLMRGAIGGRLTRPGTRIDDMDRLGIDIQVLSPSPTQYYGWADETLAARIVATQNQAIARVVRENPTRFVGLGAVALQHPQLAAEQLRTAMHEHGLHGVEFTSDPTGAGLDDPALEPFWEMAESLQAVLFLHPLGTSLGERVNRHYLSNIVGQPLETTVALSQLIHGGVLDRFPRLRICAAHGGGYLPFAVGRSDHGYGVRPESRTCHDVPSAYLRRIWFDTVVFRADALRTLIKVAGATQVVAGTDYPFDMGEYALHELVSGLPHEQAVAILGGNAQTLLRLPDDHPALCAARQRLAPAPVAS